MCNKLWFMFLRQCPQKLHVFKIKTLDFGWDSLPLNIRMFKCLFSCETFVWIKVKEFLQQVNGVWRDVSQHLINWLLWPDETLQIHRYSTSVQWTIHRYSTSVQWTIHRYSTSVNEPYTATVPVWMNQWRIDYLTEHIIKSPGKHSLIKHVLYLKEYTLFQN